MTDVSFAHRRATLAAFGLVARGRHLFLPAAGLLAVLLMLLTRWFWWVAGGTMAVLTVGLYGLSVVAILLYHPRELCARPALGAFEAPLNPNRALLAGAFTFMGTTVLVLQPGAQSQVARVVALVVLAVVTAGLWYLGWRWNGVRLTAGGLTDHQPFGSLFVPWAAFAGHDPAVPIGRNQLALYFDRPELVVRRGYRPGSTHYLTAGADADLLARVIAEYVAEPARRAAIGSETELRRVL
ncbi:hypothetical protein [Paractinoplanes ferrugineus]|nr:hypothetical protein [Actinoplanes ferrugineus]